MNELLLLCVNTDSYYFSSSENHHRPNTKQTKPVKQQTTMTLLLARLCNYFFGFHSFAKKQNQNSDTSKKTVERPLFSSNQQQLQQSPNKQNKILIIIR